MSSIPRVFLTEIKSLVKTGNVRLCVEVADKVGWVGGNIISH